MKPSNLRFNILSYLKIYKPNRASVDEDCNIRNIDIYNLQSSALIACYLSCPHYFIPRLNTPTYYFVNEMCFCLFYLLCCSCCVFVMLFLITAVGHFHCFPTLLTIVFKHIHLTNWIEIYTNWNKNFVLWLWTFYRADPGCSTNFQCQSFAMKCNNQYCKPMSDSKISPTCMILFPHGGDVFPSLYFKNVSLYVIKVLV